jgi:UDP-glucose 4-epimerase
MSILITGGAGYIGGQMVLDLVDQGHEVVVVDNLSTGFRSSVPDGVPLHVADVGDFETMSGLLRRHRVRSVIHFAGRIFVAESVADPLGYYHANTEKARALIAASIGAGVERFVFSSTAAVYGAAGLAPIDETQPAAPLSPYGSSKWMSEWILRDAARAHGLKYAILRYFNVAGADPTVRHGESTVNSTHLIKLAAEVVVGKRPFLELYGQDYPTPDGTCVRDYIHVCDVVSAHRTALAHLSGGGESLVVNAGYGRGYSVREVIDAVRSVSGVDFEVRQQLRRDGDPASIIAASDRLRALGWRPAHDDLATIIRHALAWETELKTRRAQGGV